MAATPGAAVAADNTPPERPRVEDLTTGGNPCAVGEDAPYSRWAQPQVGLTLRDAEQQRLTAELEVRWTDAEGVEQLRRRTHILLSPETHYDMSLGFSVPADTRASWRVRAVDEQGAVSAWSDEDGGHACEFVTDLAPPTRPTVDSPEYPESDPSDPQDGWHDGAGVYGGFTFDSPSDDVVLYQYSFNGGAPRSLRPDEPGGPVTVRLMPQAGLAFVTVQAFDRAGNSSSPTDYHFRVGTGRANVARWKLADSPAAEAGPALRAEDGVAFRTAAPAGTGLTGSARLSGAGDGYLTPDAPAVDTKGTFAVSGWVRPDRTDRVMTLASQDAADGTSAFTLGLRPATDGRDGVWSFAFGGARVTGGHAQTGEWAHLLGLFDTEDDMLTLYVNGARAGEPVQASPVAAPGSFQIGRARGDGGQRWQGDLADVRVWDRVVVPSEAAELAVQQAALTGAWQFESAQDGSSPAVRGDVPFTLGGGAEIREDPLWWAAYGMNQLALDGSGGYAVTAAPVVDTGDSFTVAALVDLADWPTARDQAAFTVGGDEGGTLSVRYRAETGSWQVVSTGADGTASVLAEESARSGYPNALVLVHDARADELRLYVEGQTGNSARADYVGAGNVEGTLVLGQARTADGWGDHLAGTVDEVRVWNGVLPLNDLVTYYWTAP
jgi:hypothetical protein